jgi:hypothetical protein
MSLLLSFSARDDMSLLESAGSVAPASIGSTSCGVQLIPHVALLYCTLLGMICHTGFIGDACMHVSPLAK